MLLTVPQLSTDKERKYSPSGPSAHAHAGTNCPGPDARSDDGSQAGSEAPATEDVQRDLNSEMVANGIDSEDNFARTPEQGKSACARKPNSDASSKPGRWLLCLPISYFVALSGCAGCETIVGYCGGNSPIMHMPGEVGSRAGEDAAGGRCKSGESPAAKRALSRPETTSPMDSLAVGS